VNSSLPFLVWIADSTLADLFQLLWIFFRTVYFFCYVFRNAIISALLRARK
jgi:uncharacterized MAPEG superfamily protein